MENNILGGEELKNKVKQLIPSLKEDFIDFFQDRIPDVRENRIIQIVLVRETESYVKLTTDGQIIDRERTIAGYPCNSGNCDRSFIHRVVMLKRKQVASERRTGKEFLRSLYKLYPEILDVLGSDSDDNKDKLVNCALTENLCGICPDCFIYGFAAQEEVGGSRRSRVYTDSAFSILNDNFCVERKLQNAVKEKIGTEEEGETLTGQALFEFEYVRPHVFFPSVETLFDVTLSEFLYVLRNIVYTERYGGEKSTGGIIRNHILGIYFLDRELFSNLLLTQAFYCKLRCKLGENIRDTKIEDIKEVFPDVEKCIIGERNEKIDNIDNSFISQFKTFIENEESKKILAITLFKDIKNWLEKHPKYLKKQRERGKK